MEIYNVYYISLPPLTEAVLERAKLEVGVMP